MSVLGESVRRRQRLRATYVGPRRRPWLTWLIGLPLALLVPFAVGYFIAVRLLFPPPPESGTGIAVPELIGRGQAEAQRLATAAGLGGLETVPLPHPNAPPGQVVAQSPLPGQQLRGGATVQVAISSGPPRVRVPDVIGFGAEGATSMLKRSGFEVIQARQEAAGAPGRVIAMDPRPGQVRQLPATVTIVVSAPLPVDTMTPDTSRRAALFCCGVSSDRVAP